MRATNPWLAAGALLLGASSAFAVSSGYYTPGRQHCSGYADDYLNTTAEPGCYSVIITVLDGNGHEYFGAGGHQTYKSSLHQFDIWIDPGQGTTYTFTADTTTRTVTGPVTSASVEPLADPSSGLQLYFGADDNVQGNGEHDGSTAIHNGPSDGGGSSVQLSRDAAEAWLSSLQSLDLATLLSNPLPIGEAGAGGCADGTCYPGAAAVRTIIFQGGAAAPAHRDAPNYEGKQWPPDGCSGASATEEAKCQADDTVDPGHTGILYWYNLEGSVYLQPGISIYEDPDPQASPLISPAPIPALYIGSCGFIFGGGGGLIFSGPGTNSAGQVALLNPLCN